MKLSAEENRLSNVEKNKLKVQLGKKKEKGRREGTLAYVAEVGKLNNMLL